MASNVAAFDLVKPPKSGGGMAPRAPRILYGTGTPDGEIEPLVRAEKGSVFLSTNQTGVAVWVKEASNAATADWVAINGTKTLASMSFNMDAGAGVKVHDVFYFPRAITIASARLVYTEATDASGAADATIRMGTTDEGVGIVAAVAWEANKAVGATKALTIVSGAVSAGGFVDIMLTGCAATEAGQAKVVFTYTEA